MDHAVLLPFPRSKYFQYLGRQLELLLLADVRAFSEDGCLYMRAIEVVYLRRIIIFALVFDIKMVIAIMICCFGRGECGINVYTIEKPVFMHADAVDHM